MALRTYIQLMERIESNQRMKEKLAESEKLAAIATLSAGVNHEVGNALNGMVGGLAILEKEIKKKSNGQEFDISRLQLSHEKFREGITRAKDIIDGLSIAVRKDDIQKLYFNLLHNVKQGLGIMSDKVSKCGVNVSIDIDPRIEVEYNPTALMQIWMNLISNACDALESTKDRRLTIIGKEQGGKYQVEVTDNGPGIKHGNQIFDALFTTKDPGKGTGLGLYQVKGVVQRLGGEIDFDKNHVGGAKFILQLPVFKHGKTHEFLEPLPEQAPPKKQEVQKQQQSEKPKDVAPTVAMPTKARIEYSTPMPSSTRLHVVHLDDEQSALDAVREIAPSHWDIHSFTSIDECLAYLKNDYDYKQEIDFFLCDINMGVEKRGVEIMQGRGVEGEIIRSDDIYYLTAYDPSEIKSLNLQPLMSFEGGPIRRGGMIKKPLSKQDIAHLNRKYMCQKGDFSYISPRVLLVDDERQNHDAFKEAAPSHWQIACIENPKKAFEQIRKFAPHCIVTDIDMPGLNGAELAEFLKDATHLDIPIIGLSAHAEEIAKAKYNWPNLPFFQKPISTKLFNLCKKMIDETNIVVLQYPDKISDVKMLYSYFQDYLAFTAKAKKQEYSEDPWNWSKENWNKLRAQNDEMARLTKSIGLSEVEKDELFAYAKANTATDTQSIKQQNKPRIIIVDDNKNLIPMYKTLWADEYEVKAYYDLDYAFEVMHRFQPNLILIDISMPGIAEKTIEAIVKNFPELNIVIQSGHSYDHVRNVLDLDIPKEKYHWKADGIIDPAKYFQEWQGKMRSYTSKFSDLVHRKSFEVRVKENNAKDVEPIVFVFDDETGNLDTFLEHAPKNWRVFCFNDPTKDLLRVQNLKPHILVTDQKMPKTTGANLALVGDFTGSVLQTYIVSAYEKAEVEKNYDELGLQIKGTKPKFFKKPVSKELIQDIEYCFNSYPREIVSGHSNIDRFASEGKPLKIACYASNQPDMVSTATQDAPEKIESQR